MKKLLSFILAALIVSSALVSCAQNDAPKETDAPQALTTETAAAAEETTYLDTLEEKNFDGASYIISVPQQGTLPASAVEITGEIINDTIYERNLLVSDQFNVKIEYSQEQGAANTNIINAVRAGDYFSDLYIDALSNGKDYMSNVFRNGALYNLMDVPYLQPDKPWWSQLMYEKLQYNGKMFFTSGDIATASYYAPACVFMNASVAEENIIDVDEIYQLVYNNAWTIDEVMKRTNGLRKDLNGDGLIQPSDDAYGIVSATVELTATEICVGAGIRYCGIDEDGELSVDLNTEQVINTLEKLKQCFCEIRQGEDWAPIWDAFREDRVLFLVHFVGTAIDFRDMESDFIILPMAKYDAEQESYMSYTNPHSVNYVAIPLIQPDIERTGFITEALEYLSVEMVRPTIYDVTLKGKVSRDPDSQAMLDMIFNTTYIDFNTLNQFGGSTSVLGDALFGDKDFVSSYQKIGKRLNKDLENFRLLFE